MLSNAAKDHHKPAKQRTLRTPEPVQSRVIAHHFSGLSNRKIAAAEGLDPDTVGRILSQEEVAQKREEYRAQVFGLVPKSIRAYDEILESDDLRTKAAIATKVLEGYEVLPKGRIEQPAPPPDARLQKWIVLGQIKDMALTKHDKYGTTLPPELEGLKEEARQRLEGLSPGTTPQP